MLPSAATVVLSVYAEDGHSGQGSIQAWVDGARYAPGSPLNIAGRTQPLELRIAAADQAGNTASKLMTLQPSPVYTLQGLEQIVTETNAAGLIQDTLAAQLQYRLTIIGMLLEQGTVQTAVAYLDSSSGSLRVYALYA
ncbi:hypothetical protein FE784_36740 [Paenibacillus hemerocallicola]|uniref:Uncharacterized protein n=1 Tax=Paenibacillus hemerocallicola TaxID=1172614 RepID=A0A5C4SXJ2_9BACL|nr:hypothetical protein [Paenibacillus hemerocallicola]TNJ59880.1 hypothetical protein FE784_36740 [Paenibacillus hemerocallicola]